MRVASGSTRNASFSSISGRAGLQRSGPERAFQREPHSTRQHHQDGQCSPATRDCRSGLGLPTSPLGGQLLLAWFEIAGGIVFEVGLVAAQPVLANNALARLEVGNADARVVAALPADDLSTGRRIDPS